MENMISYDTVFGIAEGVKTRTEDFGLLVVSKATPALSLNDDAMAVWELCNGTNTVNTIVKTIQENYQNEGVETLVIETLDNFLKLGLIKQIL